MGQFSWLDCVDDSQIVDDEVTDVYVLVPKEFGGGHIKETCYEGYGIFGGHDIFDLVADWNREFIPEVLKIAREGNWHGSLVVEESEYEHFYEGKPITCEKRLFGIGLACYDEDNARIPYPIKITHYPTVVYEDCVPSLVDDNQGWPLSRRKAKRDNGMDSNFQQSCKKEADYKYEDKYEEDGEIDWEKYDNELLWNILKAHRGHRIEISTYGDWDNPANISLEDMDTNEVILDAELYTICAREDV